MVRLEGTRLAQLLDLVDELVTTIVAVVRITLGVLVGEAGTEALHDGSGGEVLGVKREEGYNLRSDHFEGLPGTVLLLLDQIEEFRIVFGERDATGLWGECME